MVSVDCWFGEVDNPMVDKHVKISCKHGAERARLDYVGRSTVRIVKYNDDTYLCAPSDLHDYGMYWEVAITDCEKTQVNISYYVDGKIPETKWHNQL